MYGKRLSWLFTVQYSTSLGFSGVFGSKAVSSLVTLSALSWATLARYWLRLSSSPSADIGKVSIQASLKRCKDQCKFFQSTWPSRRVLFSLGVNWQNQRETHSELLDEVRPTFRGIAILLIVIHLPLSTPFWSPHHVRFCLCLWSWHPKSLHRFPRLRVVTSVKASASESLFSLASSFPWFWSHKWFYHPHLDLHPCLVHELDRLVLTLTWQRLHVSSGDQIASRDLVVAWYARFVSTQYVQLWSAQLEKNTDNKLDI